MDAISQADIEQERALIEAGPVFISHASTDSAVADLLVTQLELVQLRCWIAPRDIPTGTDYAGEIVRAIRAASAVVFLFSTNSNVSNHCLREIEEAIKLERPIIPIRLDETAMSEGFEYRLSTVQWLDYASANFHGRVAATLSAITRSAPQPAGFAPEPLSPRVSTRSLMSPTVEHVPLRGRTKYVTQLIDVLDTVAETARGRFVLLGGTSGVGKSAIAAYVASLAAAKGYRVVSATCGSFLDGVAFFPIRELLRQLSDSVDTLGRVKQLYGPHSEQASMAAIIDSTIAEPSARRDAMLATFANLVYGVANGGEGQLILLLLEDLEYVDAGSVDALLCLFARIQDGPVVVLGNYRTDVGSAGPSTSALRSLQDAVNRNPRDGVALTIAPLSRDDYPQIIGSILGAPAELPSRVLDYLWNETEGNALFLREIVTAVGASNDNHDGDEAPHLVQVDGVWRFIGSVDDLRTPPSVEEAIERNLRNVSGTERSYLEFAAVIGKQFGFDLEVGLAGASDDEVLDALERSIAQAIIRELSEPSDSFEFRHNKVRDVLYHSITLVRRKRIHSKIADLILLPTDQGVAERETLIGEHLFLAERYSESAEYLNRSALRLMDMLESSRAAIQFGRVLIALEKSGDQATVDVASTTLHRIEALKLSSDYDTAIELCRGLIAMDGITESDRGWGLDYLGDLLWTQGKGMECLAAYREAERIANETGDEALALEVDADLVEYFDRERERLAGIDEVAAARHAAESEQYLLRQFDLAQKSTDRFARSRSFRNWAKHLRKSDDIDGALHYYELSLGELDPRVASHQVLISYAKTLRFAGRQDEAARAVERVLNWSAQTGARRSRAISLHYRAILAMDDVDAPESALGDIDMAIALHSEIGYGRGEREVRLLRGEWLAAAGRWDEAFDELRRSLQIDDRDAAATVALAGEQLTAIDERARSAKLVGLWRRHAEHD